MREASPPTVPSRVPRREAIAGGTVRAIEQGGPTKADLLLVDAGDGPCVVKDFAAKNVLIRLVGRYQIRREATIYRRLGAMPGIPRFVGRVDAHALAVEWIDGELLATHPDRVTGGERYVARLREVVDRMHALGVVHLDLRSNKNVLVRPDGEVVVIDLASAVWLPAGSLRRRLWFRRLRDFDLSGWLKWKLVLEAGPLTGDEQALLDRHRRASRFWFLNPKQK